MSSNTSTCSSSQDTSSCSEQAANITLIIGKLGHDLEEIRSRALANLLSKLSSHVITEHDLIQQKQLFIKLFELFNFPKFNQQETVLDLLLNLSKHKSAARNIQDISGLQFLNAMLVDMKSDDLLRAKVEQIVDALMRTLGIGAGNTCDTSIAESSCSSLTLTYKNEPSCSQTLSDLGSSQLFSFRNPIIMESSESSNISSVNSFMKHGKPK